MEEFNKDTQTILALSTVCLLVIEPAHNETNKMAYATSEDSDQPGHPPSLIIVFAMRSDGS